LAKNNYQYIRERTHLRIIVPVQQLVLSIAQSVVAVAEDRFQSEVETVSFSVQLISRHPGQAEVKRLVHCQQRRCQFTHKVVLLTCL